MTPKPKRRCETCRHFQPSSEDPSTGLCTSVAIAHEKKNVPVRAEITSCAGLYFGKPDLWEPKKSGWWPFGK